MSHHELSANVIVPTIPIFADFCVSDAPDNGLSKSRSLLPSCAMPLTTYAFSRWPWSTLDRPIILPDTHVFLFLFHLLAQKLFSHVNPSIIRETLQRYNESDQIFGETRQFDGGDIIVCTYHAFINHRYLDPEYRQKQAES